MTRKIVHKNYLLLLVFLMLMACSGGETGTGVLEDPIPKDTTTSVGRITSLDGVSVNGIKYSTDNTTFALDEQSGAENELDIGMVVVIQGKINEDGLTGEATHIEYKDVLEGIVTGKNLKGEGIGALTIMSQTVVVDALTVFDSNVDDSFTILQVENGSIVEVSGFTSGNGTIYATRIEQKKTMFELGDEIELKGVLSNLTETTFDIGQLTIDYSGAQIVDFPAEGMKDGQLVQAVSTEGLGLMSEFFASSINLQGDGSAGVQFGDGEKIKLEGVVTTLVTADQEFALNGQLVVVTDTTNIVNGNASDIVETSLLIVDGSIDTSGVVLADKILFLGKVDISMEAFVESVDVTNNSLVVLGTTLFIDNFTLLSDQRNKDGFIALRNFTLADLQIGNRVEIDIEELVSSGFFVKRLERKNIKDNEVKLEGRLDKINGNQLLIAGINIDISMAVVPQAEFQIGSVIKVTGMYDILLMTFQATKVAN